MATILTVRVLALDDEGRDFEHGKINYDMDAEKFTLDLNEGGDENLLRSVVEEDGPRILGQGYDNNLLTFKSDPVRFMNELWRQYKSPYLRVTKVGE